MLDEQELARVATHGMTHGFGMCTCPCYDALIKVAEALKKEMDLRVKLAKASPDALAALTIGAVSMEEEDDDGSDPIGGEGGSAYAGGG